MERTSHLFARLVFVLIGWFGLTVSGLAIKHGVPREFAFLSGIAISAALAWRTCAREVDEPFAVALCLVPRWTYLPAFVLLYCGIGYGKMDELTDPMLMAAAIGVITRVCSERTAGERLTIDRRTWLSATIAVTAQLGLLWDHPIATAAGISVSVVVVAIFMIGQTARLRERFRRPRQETILAS